MPLLPQLLERRLNSQGLRLITCMLFVCGSSFDANTLLRYDNAIEHAEQI